MNASLRTVGALLRKDFADFAKNPSMLVVCLMPVGFMLLYSRMIDVGGDAAAQAELTKFFLGSALVMAVGMVGSMCVLYGIAEEKEKHTLRTLMLANVRASQVVISRSVVALVAIALVEAACFFVVGAPAELLAPYMALGIAGAVPVILASLTLGLACRDQMTAGLYSVPVLILAMVPMFGSFNETAGRIGAFMPVGGVYDLMELAVDGTLATGEALQPVLVTLAWVILGAAAFAVLFKRLARDN